MIDLMRNKHFSHTIRLLINY